jgi:RuvB-like protein 2
MPSLIDMAQPSPFQGTEVEKEDVRRVYGLFQDQGRSTQFLKDYQSEFMFDEGDERGDEEEEGDAMEEA